VPSPLAHLHCYSICYLLLLDGGGYLPFARLASRQKLYQLLADAPGTGSGLMPEGLAQPRFTATADAATGEVFHSFSRGICPQLRSRRQACGRSPRVRSSSVTSPGNLWRSRSWRRDTTAPPLDIGPAHDHHGHMKAGVAELKAGLSRYLERVKAGHEVVVTDRGRPVAKLVPITAEARRGTRRERLVREGLLLPGRGRVRASLLELPAGSAAQGRAVLDALIEERREGR